MIKYVKNAALGTLVIGAVLMMPNRLHAAQQQEAVKSEVVYVSKTGSKYHRSTCKSLRYSAIPIDRQLALQMEYTPCKVCRP